MFLVLLELIVGQTAEAFCNEGAFVSEFTRFLEGALVY